MEKKPLTIKQKQTRYRAAQYGTFGGEFLSILAPFVAMGIVNYDEWFQNENGWKVGLGGTLALALLGLAVFLVGKKKEDDKITGGYITLILGWFAVAFIFMLLSNIMDQISTIMFFGGIGLLGAFGLDIASKNFKKKADFLKQTMEKAKEEVVKEEVIKELDSGDVKF